MVWGVEVKSLSPEPRKCCRFPFLSPTPIERAPTEWISATTQWKPQLQKPGKFCNAGMNCSWGTSLPLSGEGPECWSLAEEGKDGMTWRYLKVTEGDAGLSTLYASSQSAVTISPFHSCGGWSSGRWSTPLFSPQSHVFSSFLLFFFKLGYNCFTVLC